MSFLEMDPEVTIMFHRVMNCFVSRENLEVSLSDDYNRKKLPPEFESNIEETWREKANKNATLYNGTKFRLDSITGDEHSKKVVFNLGITCYKDFIGTNWSPNAKLYCSFGSSEHGNSQAYLSDALGVGALLETKDNFVVLLKRSLSCGEAPGLWDIPGGHPEPKVLVGKKSVEEIDLSQMSPQAVVNEIFNSTLMEIMDEVNIPRMALSDPVLLGVARNTTSAGRPSSEYYVRCNLTAEEIRALYNQGTQVEADESDGIMFLPLSQITSFQVTKSDTWQQMAPSAKGCLLLYASAFNRSHLS